MRGTGETTRLLDPISHVLGHQMTPPGCKGIWGGPDMQSLANFVKLCADQFEVPPLSTISAEEIGLPLGRENCEHPQMA